MALFDINITDNENRDLFITQITFSLLAAVANFIAFVSPYWVEAQSGANALFNRIGLWTACFDGYMRPDNCNRAYFGCFYIYHYGYDEIRNWLNPGVFFNHIFMLFSVVVCCASCCLCWATLSWSGCIFPTVPSDRSCCD